MRRPTTYRTTVATCVLSLEPGRRPRDVYTRPIHLVQVFKPNVFTLVMHDHRRGGNLRGQALCRCVVLAGNITQPAYQFCVYRCCAHRPTYVVPMRMIPSPSSIWKCAGTSQRIAPYTLTYQQPGHTNWVRFTQSFLLTHHVHAIPLMVLGHANKWIILTAITNLDPNFAAPGDPKRLRTST